MSVGALIFTIVLFHVVILLATKFFGPFEVMAASMSEEAMKERAYALHGPSGETDDGVQVDFEDAVRVLCWHLSFSCMPLDAHCPRS